MAPSPGPGDLSPACHLLAFLILPPSLCTYLYATHPGTYRVCLFVFVEKYDHPGPYISVCKFLPMLWYPNLETLTNEVPY